MYGPGRGRALSLVHIPESEPEDGGGDTLTAGYFTTGALNQANSEPDL